MDGQYLAVSLYFVFIWFIDIIVTNNLKRRRTMKLKTLLLSVIILLGICVGVAAATDGIIFARPTEKQLAGHNMAQAHLYFDNVEVPPMYCTVAQGKITIHGQAVPDKQASSNIVRLEWRNEKGEVIYQITKTLPGDKKIRRKFTLSNDGWIVTTPAPVKKTL